MDMPEEKVAELKSIIHSHLDQIDIHDRIQSCLKARQSELNLTTEDEITSFLHEDGIVEEILSGLAFEKILRQPNVDSQPGLHSRKEQPLMSKQNNLDLLPVDPKKRYIYMQIVKGRAFLEHIQDPEVTPGNTSSYFILYVLFRGQRYESKQVLCSCDPDFQEGFLLNLQKASSNERLADAATLLSLSSQIQLVLTRTDASQDCQLVASHELSWHKLLSTSHGVLTLAVELNGIGAENKVPVGILDVKMQFLPKINDGLAADVIAQQHALEKSRTSERERLFLMYTKQWWKEFLGIRGNHGSRLVKIFAQDENGVHNPVCRFVRALNTNRLIDSPREAARFVSLFGYEKSTSLGASSSEMWTGMHAFLCRGKGDAESHALLLCSLLIGFGLNAFVCIGTKAKGVSHAWVATVGEDADVVFWETLTAERFVHKPIDPCAPPLEPAPRQEHTYGTIGCLFNHESFYANAQPTDHVDTTVFDLRNEALWKAMSVDAVRSVCGDMLSASGLHREIPLLPSVIDSARQSKDCEKQLKSMVLHHRQDIGLSMQWDDTLSYILGPALASYELQHTAGVSIGNLEFQQAVRHRVPNGHTFKAFPIQFTHTSARRAFASCLRSAVCEEIIRCRGDAVRHAVRVKIVAYPERRCAMWIMLAVQYKSVL